MVPDINLKYFDAWYVKYVLMMIIERKIYEANKHHPKLRTFAGAHRDTGLAYIVKIKGSMVSGLADIEILSSCDLTAQTCGVSPQIAMAIAFDDNLNRALWARMNIREPRMVFEGGSDPKRASSAWTYAMWRGSKRHRKLERRWEEFDAAAVEFWQRHLEKFFG